MPFGHVHYLEARARQQQPRLAVNTLAVLQRTGIVIGDPVRLDIAGRQTKLGEEFGYVSRQSTNLFRRRAADQMCVIFHGGAAARRINDNGVEPVRQFLAPRGDVRLGQRLGLRLAADVQAAARHNSRHRL